MIEIKDLLARFDHILLSETIKKESIQKVLKDVIHIQVDSDDIKIKNNVIYLNIKPIYKNEIFMQQEKIFAYLQDMLGNKGPNNIRY